MSSPYVGRNSAPTVAQDAALLRFLEIVVNRGPACPLSELLAELCSTAFTFEMRQAVGGATEAALSRFLLKFPSLFTLDGDLVAAASDFSGVEKPTSLSSLRRPFDKVEQDAVDYFRSRFFKRETSWMSIVSLAGHLSQSSPEIRKVVGPQTDFKKFLIRHPEAFVVENQKVSLKLDKPAPQSGSESGSTDTTAVSASGAGNGGGENGDSSPRSGSNNNNKDKDKDSSFDRRSSSSIGLGAEVSSQSGRCVVVKLTPAEHRALMFVKQIVERRGPVRFHNLTGFFSQAPDAIRDTIGRSKYELEQFVHSYPQIFEIDSEDVVRVRRDARLNFIIVDSAANGSGSRPGSSCNKSAVRALHQRRARIFHLAKLWGTIDLGKHEHVFFDRSIFPREPAYDDLRTLFAPGQFVAFNAVQAPTTSRAKWRATCVWREDGRPPPDAAFATPTATLNGGNEHADSDDMANGNLREPSIIDELDWDCSNDLVLSDSFNDDFLDSCMGGESLINSDALLSNLRIPLGLPEGVRTRLPLLGQLYADQGYMVVDPEAIEKPQRRVTDGAERRQSITSNNGGYATKELHQGGISSNNNNNGHNGNNVNSNAVAAIDDDTSSSHHPHPHHHAVMIEDAIKSSNGSSGSNNDRHVHSNGNKVDQACQTLATGDILATRIFYNAP